MQDKELWRKLLGTKMKSFTEDGEYTLFLSDEGYTCNCMDFRIRQGSYRIRFCDEKEEWHYIDGCKHIAQHLANIGMKKVFKQTTYGSLIKVEPYEDGKL